MPKMRIFKFWNEAGEEKEKEAMSLKKATMSVQSDFKDKVIGKRGAPETLANSADFHYHFLGVYS